MFQVEGVSVGLLICEDAWFDEPGLLAKESGAELLAVINASPFHVGKGGERVARMAERARALDLPLVYAHLVGGQDEVVFDGASFAVNADGALAGRAPGFQEDLFYVQTERGRRPPPRAAAPTWCTSAAPRPNCGTPWCWACATTSARTAFPACCWACRAASTRPWCWPLPWTRWAATRCAP